jgi:hypothetical protein
LPSMCRPELIPKSEKQKQTSQRKGLSYTLCHLASQYLRASWRISSVQLPPTH